jgi:hypothetical protein
LVLLFRLAGPSQFRGLARALKVGRLEISTTKRPRSYTLEAPNVLADVELRYLKFFPYAEAPQFLESLNHFLSFGLSDDIPEAHTRNSAAIDQEAGYGREIQNVEQSIAGGAGANGPSAPEGSVYSAEGSGFAEDAFSTHLKRAAARLDALRERRVAEASVSGLGGVGMPGQPWRHATVVE